MAAIVKRKRKDGSASYFVKYRDGAGKQRWEQCDRWEEARSRKTEVENELRQNRSWSPPERLTFEDYAATWLERLPRHRVSERVLANYDRALRLVLVPEFGAMELGDIRRRHVNDLIGKLVAEGKARNTIRNYVVTPLRRMLNDAVDDELIPGNPAARIEIPQNAPVRQPEPPTPDELARILAVRTSCTPGRRSSSWLLSAFASARRSHSAGQTSISSARSCTCTRRITLGASSSGRRRKRGRGSCRSMPPRGKCC